MKVLVTGGAGFIGSHVADMLTEAGHEAVVVDNLKTGRRENVPGTSTFYELDIRDKDRLADVFKKEDIDAISHQAALANVRESMKNPAAYTEVNVIGTLNLLELAHEYGCEKFVFASTGGAVYGEGHSEAGDRLPFKETTWPQPKDNYGANKLSAEYHIDLYKQNYDIDYVVLRYPNVYGPRQDSKGEAGVVAIFIGAMLKGHSTQITGDGSQYRDFTYVGDIARANLLSVERAPETHSHGIYNVGTGVPTDINTIHRTLAELTEYDQETVNVPRPPGEVLATYLDSSRAREELGWEAKVSLQEGLRRTVEWAKVAWK